MRRWITATVALFILALTAKTPTSYQVQKEYALQFACCVAAGFNPADSLTYSFGNQATTAANSATDSLYRVVSPVTGTVVRAYGQTQVGGTLSSGESVTFRVKNITSTSTGNITTSGVMSSAINNYSNTAMTLAVSAGDVLEIQQVTPAWATNPTTTYMFFTVVVSGV